MTWRTSRLRVSCIFLFFSLLYYHVFFILFFLSFLSAVSPFYPFLLLVLILPRILLAHPNSTYKSERFSEYFPPPDIATETGRVWRDRRLYAIVVSRLLFPGNFTSFANYPLRAHAVWMCRGSPDRKEGAREWQRCRLIFSHRINPAPASRRGLILHGGCRRPCVCQGNIQEFRTASRSPAYRPNDLPSCCWSTDPRISILIKQYTISVVFRITNIHIYTYKLVHLLLD